MSNAKFIALSGDRKFVSEECPGIGWYLYVFSGEKCTHDYLQDTFELTAEQAFEEFGVPPDAWQKVTS